MNELTEYIPVLYATFWSLVPPLVAIILALITKEVYSSLFIGIVIGGLFYGGLFTAHFSFETSVTHIFNDGLVGVLSDPANIGILIFLVILGIMVCMMNRAGGSSAFGEWASKRIKTRTGAQLVSILLGALICIDDYFNCLTVGSVMRPVTDSHQISRAKLAYIIDATAAPICIIAPISSWAAAVTGFVESEDGFSVFMKSIPYNYYAIICCVIGMIYTGGFFSGTPFIEAFSDCDAPVGLMLGSFFAMVITVFFYAVRKVLPFKESFACIPEGFKAMVPAILILTFAWTLKSMTDSLGAKEYVAGLVNGASGSLLNFLPAIIFLVAIFLAFATGTSWGTFGILIPIVVNTFSGTDNTMMIISISACMAGAVCGDHCSPISDTTIMASAGAQCNHMNHVSTQLPYVVVVAAVSFITYIIAGFIHNPVVPLIIGIVLMTLTIILIKYIVNQKQSNS